MLMGVGLSVVLWNICGGPLVFPTLYGSIFPTNAIVSYASICLERVLHQHSLQPTTACSSNFDSELRPWVIDMPKSLLISSPYTKHPQPHNNESPQYMKSLIHGVFGGWEGIVSGGSDSYGFEAHLRYADTLAISGTWSDAVAHC